MSCETIRPFRHDYSSRIVSEDLRLKEGVNLVSKSFQVHQLAQTVRVTLDRKA